jgi:hypothetical protein
MNDHLNTLFYYYSTQHHKALCNKVVTFENIVAIQGRRIPIRLVLYGNPSRMVISPKGRASMCYTQMFLSHQELRLNCRAKPRWHFTVT